MAYEVRLLVAVGQEVSPEEWSVSFRMGRLDRNGQIQHEVFGALEGGVCGNWA